MLACLIAVPLAALFGTKLPELAKNALGDRWKVISDLLPGSHSEGSTAAPAAQAGGPPVGSYSGPAPSFPQTTPAFAPQWSAENRPPAELAAPGASATSLAPLAGGVVNNFTTPGASPSPGAVAASYNEPVAAGGTAGFTGFPGQPSPGGPTVPRPASSMALGMGDLNRRPEAPQATAPPPFASVPNLGASPAPAGDRFTQYQRRLQELGAIYYLLETWGERGQLFRFYCKVGVGGNPNYTRYFDATDPEPLGAMAKVVQQVEASQSTLR